MIIFGIRTKFISAVPLLMEFCRHCNQKNTLTMAFYQRYFHIFWIPLIPLGKIVYTVCEHCKETRGKEEFTDPLLTEVQSAKKAIKTPWKLFIVPIVLLGGFLIFNIVSVIAGFTLWLMEQ